MALSFPLKCRLKWSSSSDRIVVGHDVQKDIVALEMDLQSHILRLQHVFQFNTPVTLNPNVRDTQKYSGYGQFAKPNAHQGPNLKTLALEVLGRRIKQGRTSSVEDAVATIELYRKTEVDIDREQPK